LREHRSKAGVMRPNGDMTEPDTWTPKKETRLTRLTPKKGERFEGKVRELGDAIDALPDDRADLAAELFESEDVSLGRAFDDD
jgi:hypothetical protein